jgi:hypothetical protein
VSFEFGSNGCLDSVLHKGPSYSQYFLVSYQLGMCVLPNNRLTNCLSVSLCVNCTLHTGPILVNLFASAGFSGKCPNRHWRRFSGGPLLRKRACISNGTLHLRASPRYATHYVQLHFESKQFCFRSGYWSNSRRLPRRKVRHQVDIYCASRFADNSFYSTEC